MLLDNVNKLIFQADNPPNRIPLSFLHFNKKSSRKAFLRVSSDCD